MRVGDHCLELRCVSRVHGLNTKSLETRGPHEPPSLAGEGQAFSRLYAACGLSTQGDQTVNLHQARFDVL